MSDPEFDNVLAALMLFGVHEGYGLQRRALAGELRTDGWTSDDVELVAGWCRRNHPRARLAPKLAGILSDAQERQERLDDIRAVQEAQAAAEAKRSGLNQRFATTDTPTDPEVERWREDDRAIAVASRVDTDMRGAWRAVGNDTHYLTDDEKLERVCDEFQIGASTAAHLLARGRVLLEHRRFKRPAPAKVEPEVTPEERLQMAREAAEAEESTP